MAAHESTVFDLFQAIDRLDNHGTKNEDDVVEIDGKEISVLDMRISVAARMTTKLKANMNFVRSKITKRDVTVVMAAFGASRSTNEDHADAIARIIRSDFSDGKGVTE